MKVWNNNIKYSSYKE